MNTSQIILTIMVVASSTYTPSQTYQYYYGGEPMSHNTSQGSSSTAGSGGQVYNHNYAPYSGYEYPDSYNHQQSPTNNSHQQQIYHSDYQPECHGEFTYQTPYDTSHQIYDGIDIDDWQTDPYDALDTEGEMCSDSHSRPSKSVTCNSISTKP
jgi:hypothetical protein